MNTIFGMSNGKTRSLDTNLINLMQIYATY